MTALLFDHLEQATSGLSVEQVQALADAMRLASRAMMIAQAGLGLGELLALRVEDVDFLRRTARVEFQIAPRSKTRTEPKTPRSRRTIPLPQIVTDHLAEHIANYPPGEDGSLFTTSTARSTAASTTGHCSLRR